MPYAVNPKVGTMIINADIGELPGGKAIRITERQKLIAKHLCGVVVFDSIAGINEKKLTKTLYGIDTQTLEDKNQPMMTYQDMMKKYKDPKTAAAKWTEYKAQVEK